MTKQHLAFSLVCLTLFLPTTVHAKHSEAPLPILSADKPPAPEDRRHLLGDTFTVVKTVAAIPISVRKFLMPNGKDARSGMANPGGRFEVSDAVGPEPLPFRRLILAANSAGYTLIYDEHGGIAHYEQASLYRLTQGKVTLVWQAMVDAEPPFLSFEQLRAAIRAGKYRPLAWKYGPLQGGT